jgi:hypothetical protein
LTAIGRTARADATDGTTVPGEEDPIMADNTVELTNTATWLPLTGLAPGFDANKAQPTSDLVGTEVVVTDGSTRIVHRFTEKTVRWEYYPGAGDPNEEAIGEDSYEAIMVDDGLYYAQFQDSILPAKAVSLFLDFDNGRTLTVIQNIHERGEDHTTVSQDFLPGLIEGSAPTGREPGPTIELIGRRVVWDYSPVHSYEHVYLSQHWYTWHCLAGPEKGLADTDQNTVYELRPGIYVFAWREKVIPCASVTVADHRDAHALRSHGVLFGLDETGTLPTHFTFGAYGRLLSVTVHPESQDPAR